MFPPQGVDSFSLFESQVRVAVQTLRAAVVHRYGAYIFRVSYEMVCECVEMQGPEGFVRELLRGEKATQSFPVPYYLHGCKTPYAPYELQVRRVAPVEVKDGVFLVLAHVPPSHGVAPERVGSSYGVPFRLADYAHRVPPCLPFGLPLHVPYRVRHAERVIACLPFLFPLRVTQRVRHADGVLAFRPGSLVRLVVGQRLTCGPCGIANPPGESEAEKDKGCYALFPGEKHVN